MYYNRNNWMISNTKYYVITYFIHFIGLLSIKCFVFTKYILFHLN